MKISILLLISIFGIDCIPKGAATANLDLDFNPNSNISTQLYKHGLTETLLLNKNNVVQLLNPNFDTVIFIHGYTGGDLYKSMQKAFFVGDNANRVNLIGIHWERAAQHANYREVVGRVPAVGTYVEKFIRFLQSNSFPLNKISLVGHSLGAQCAGFAGRYLKASGIMLEHIIGLDPARPGFEIPSPAVFGDVIHLEKLSYRDANNVTIIHTNPGGFGHLDSSGHTDIFFKPTSNGPQCSTGFVDLIINWTGAVDSENANMCRHTFAHKYFAEIVARNKLSKICHYFNPVDIFRNVVYLNADVFERNLTTNVHVLIPEADRCYDPVINQPIPEDIVFDVVAVRWTSE